MFDSIEKALKYIRGYCNKHGECKENYCRLYNPETGQCFICDGAIPGDWEIDSGHEVNK